MGSTGITPDPSHLKLTGQKVELRVLRDFALDPTGPFYQFVLTYLAASAGLTPVYDAEHYPTFMEGIAGIFPGATAPGARADLSESVKQVRAGALPRLQAQQSLCCMLANTAFESIDEKDAGKLKGNPVFEFFRHVRNAASHRNRWHFHSHAPVHPAAWNGIVLDASQKGASNPLHGKTCFYGNLQPADLLYLLRDVERLL